MAVTDDPQHRIHHLTEAIHSCKSLTQRLRALGSSSSGESDSSERIRDLENALHREIQSLLEARNTALAPVSRLTDDILRLIFLEYNEERLHEQEDTSRSPSSKVSSSFIIASVCRQWRAVALQTAPLWSDVSLYAPYNRLFGTCPDHPAYGPADGRIIKQRDELRLARSASAGLDVSINILRASSYVPLVAERFRESCAGRVKTLSLRTDSHDGTDDEAERFRTDLQMFSDCVRMARDGLTKLHLFGGSRTPSHRPGTLDNELNTLFNISLPHLQEVILRDIPYPVTSTFSGLSECSHVTITASSFIRSNFTTRGCLQLLEACPKLRYLSLQRVYFEAEADIGSTTQVISLPHLLVFLRAPALRDLCVICLNGLAEEDNRSADALSPILRMFDASPFVLDSLVLSDLSFVHVRAMAPLIRSLTHIRIDFGGPAVEDLDWLWEYRRMMVFLAAPDAEEPTFPNCPRLTSLEFGCSALPLLEDICNMVETRLSRSGAPIEYLELARWSSAMHMLDTQLEERVVPEYAAAFEERIGCAVGQFWIRPWKYDSVGKKWDLHKGDRAGPKQVW